MTKRHIGTFINPSGMDDRHRWAVKKAVYVECGVWKAYSLLRKAYSDRLINAEGFIDKYLANRCCQYEMDSYLLRLSRGMTSAVIPSMSCSVASSGVSSLEVKRPPETKVLSGADKGVFEGKKEVSYLESMWWIYRHLKVSGVVAEDCPDSGTWGYYQMLLSNPDAQAKFYESVFPKVAGKEVEERTVMEDDGRAQFAVLEILEKEFSDAVSE
jgi:hypothetical protein